MTVTEPLLKKFEDTASFESKLRGISDLVSAATNIPAYMLRPVFEDPEETLA